MAKRQPPQLPPKVPERDAILPAMQALIDKFDETVDAIIRTTTLENATFETVVRPWANAENETQGSWQMIDSLRFYSPSIETQDAVHKALDVLGQAQTRWAQRDDWFMLLCAALLREKDNTNLTQESRFYIERAYKDCMHFGHGLMSQRTREQYLEEEVKIMGLACAYTRNVIQESDGMWFEEKALDGVPADELARLEVDDSSPNQRKRYALSPEVRHQIATAESIKLAQNNALFDEIILRRSSQAHKLGFPNHAEFRAPKRALGSTRSIHTFLDRFENDLIPLVRRELSEMKYVRNCDREVRGLPPYGDEEWFPISDRAYCHAIMLKALQVDEDLLSEFFPLDHVMDAMLGLFTTCLGLRFDRVSGSDLDPAAKWHEDVEIFAVWDSPAEGEGEADFIGYLYLDLLFRNHKYLNGQTVNLEKGYRKSDGSRKYPSTILSLALSTPAPGTCKLLKQAELVQIFHELGHALHDLLTKTEFVRFHGAGSLPVDATEIPSMLMENLAWVEDVLVKLSRHYTTLDVKYLDQWREDNPGKPDAPESIPDELVQALVRSRWLNQSESYYGRLITSKFDMRLHSLPWKEGLQPFDVRTWCRGITLKDVKLKDFNYATCSHLVNGYDVGFFGYLVSAVYAQDIWESQFAKDPWNRETWNRYRREILQCGSAHPDVLSMIEGYLGRPVRTEPLIDSLFKGTEISVSSSDESDGPSDESTSSSDENTVTNVPGVNRKPSTKRRKSSSDSSENRNMKVADGNEQPLTKRKKE